MNVQEAIDELQKVEDKTLPLCIVDWNEQYAGAAEADVIEFVNIGYLACGRGRMQGPCICIDVNDD